MRELESAKDLLDVEESALVVAEVEEVAALEVYLDEDQTLVVLAEDGLEEPASSEDLLQYEVVRGRQVVEVVLRRRHLRRAGDLVPHRRRGLEIFTGGARSPLGFFFLFIFLGLIIG